MKYLISVKFNQHWSTEKFIFFLLILFFGSSLQLQAQKKPLDNWDLEVISKKALQNETYFDLSQRSSYTTTGLSTLLRYGIAKNYELQFTWNGSRTETFAGDVSEQTSRLGVKAHLSNESKYLPGFSVIGSFNLTLDPSKEAFMPSLNVLFRKGLSKNFKITGNYNFIVDEQTGDLSNDFAFNIDAEMTEWLTTYVGYRGFTSHPIKDFNALNQEYLELGMLFWIADGLRLYPYYDFGLSDDSEDVFNIGVLYHFK